MPAPPPVATRAYDFVAQQTANPLAPLPADALQAELDKLILAYNNLLAFVTATIRDDGAIRSGKVIPSSFNKAALGLQGTWLFRGEWTANTLYLPGHAVTKLVSGDRILYICVVTHTSGVSFTADLAADRWVSLSGSGDAGSGGGTGSALDILLAGDDRTADVGALDFRNGIFVTLGGDGIAHIDAAPVAGKLAGSTATPRLSGIDAGAGFLTRMVDDDGNLVLAAGCNVYLSSDLTTPVASNVNELRLGAGITASSPAIGKVLIERAATGDIIVEQAGTPNVVKTTALTKLIIGASLNVAAVSGGVITLEAVAPGGVITEPAGGLTFSALTSAPTLTVGRIFRADGVTYIPDPRFGGGFYFITTTTGNGSPRKLLDREDAKKIGQAWPAISGTNAYTVGEADLGIEINIRGASAKTVTVNSITQLNGMHATDKTQSINAWGLRIRQRDAGAITLAAGSGVTIVGKTSTNADRQELTLRWYTPSYVEVS